jgi:K+-sensing histidine kinase KdpD
MKTNKKLGMARVENNNLIITMPVNLLVNAAKYNPEYWKVRIKDKEAYAKAVAEKIIGFNEDSETGITQFQILFDDIQNELVEEENPTIQVKWQPEDKFE